MRSFRSASVDSSRKPGGSSTLTERQFNKSSRRRSSATDRMPSNARLPLQWGHHDRLGRSRWHVHLGQRHKRRRASGRLLLPAITQATGASSDSKGAEPDGSRYGAVRFASAEVGRSPGKPTFGPSARPEFSRFAMCTSYRSLRASRSNVSEARAEPNQPYRGTGAFGAKTPVIVNRCIDYRRSTRIARSPVGGVIRYV